jgi:putative toxin-antitoxin system antitoxin component (TIGR02293 family)
LGLGATGTTDLINIIQKGLPFNTVTHLASETTLSVPEIASLIELPSRTLARRRSSGKLRRDESERLVRLSSVFDKALELFEGDTSATVAWLKRPARALGNETPLEYARFEIGAQEVEELIGQLEHGVFS